MDRPPCSAGRTHDGWRYSVAGGALAWWLAPRLGWIRPRLCRRGDIRQRVGCSVLRLWAVLRILRAILAAQTLALWAAVAPRARMVAMASLAAASLARLAPWALASLAPLVTDRTGCDLIALALSLTGRSRTVIGEEFASALPVCASDRRLVSLASAIDDAPPCAVEAQPIASTEMWRHSLAHQLQRAHDLVDGKSAAAIDLGQDAAEPERASELRKPLHYGVRRSHNHLLTQDIRV